MPERRSQGERQGQNPGQGHGWEWDESLFRGSAPFYRKGRLPYAPGLAGRLVAAAGLDGDSRVIDIGCGPGVLALDLAPFVAAVLGLDPDPEMLAEAARRAAAAGLANLAWVQARAEDLSAALPPGSAPFHAATFGQSFHWMDRPRVAAILEDLLVPGGAFVYVADVKEPPAPPSAPPPAPTPPYAAVEDLVRRYLGPVRRAGQGTLPHGTPGGEAAVLHAAGYGAPERIVVPAGPPLVRAPDDIVAWAWSRSGSAPHLFGERREAFEADLRRLLSEVAPDDSFAEQPPDTEIVIWRTPR